MRHNPHHHKESKEIWGYFSSNEIVHFHAVSLSTQIDSLLFGPDEWEHETSGGINNCLESSLLSLNVIFQKRAWGIGLVTRREGLYRSENKQLKTFCWLHVFLWMITTCLKRCSQHQLLLWIYATPWLLYMILSAPYLALLKKGHFFKTISWPFPRCIFWFSAIIGEIAGLLSQSLLKWDRGILEQPAMEKTSGNLILIAQFGQDS